MDLESINLPARRQEAFLSLRLLGTIGMIGAPMLVVERIYRHLVHLGDNQNDQIVGVLGIIYICGWACSATAMYRLRVTGRGVWSTVIFIVQMTWLFLAGVWSVGEAFNLNPDGGNTFLNMTDAAWPLSHLFMLVVGGFALKAGVWRGWRRFSPLLCGLALPVFFAASAAVGSEIGVIVFVILTAIGFMSVGYAVRTSSRYASSGTHVDF